jgi:uncharacterized protein
MRGRRFHCRTYALHAVRALREGETDKNTFLPFHPGAVRYYREIGISIPESLVPTN